MVIGLNERKLQKRQQQQKILGMKSTFFPFLKILFFFDLITHL